MLGVIGTCATLAHAEIPISNGTPVLEFQTISHNAPPLKEHKILPYRFYNKVIVSVWDPIACGQKATNAEFIIQDNKLILRYSLSTASDHAKQCTLVSEFQIDNAPHKDLEINFAGGQESYIVAKMKRCEFYKPTSEDVWECLAPTVED